MIRRILGGLVWGAVLALLSRLPKPPAKSDIRRRTWIDRLLEAGVLFGTLGAIGILVVVSGLIPIKASSGHWPITRWFLEFSMERGFSTQSLGVKVPPLDDPGMILRGATQYETTCRPCHGSPDLKHPRVAAAMTPAPPYLPEEIDKWTPAELFTIVKHGVKFTGMPAWPAANRDDEVWSTVAFLVRFPGMDAQEYQRLAFGRAPRTGAAAPIEDLTGAENLPVLVRQRCARCHGNDGMGRGAGAFPKLAGQHEAYLFNTMLAYQTGQRHSGIMEPVAAGLTTREMREAARYYARLQPGAGMHGTHGNAHIANAAPSIARGEKIAREGLPSRKVPPCAECHGPTQPHPRHEYPMLAGQDAAYIVTQLELFHAGYRGGTEFAHLMDDVAPRLAPEQMRDVAAYYQTLGSSSAAARAQHQRNE